jgi:hypothetical protein
VPGRVVRPAPGVSPDPNRCDATSLIETHHHDVRQHHLADAWDALIDLSRGKSSPLRAAMAHREAAAPRGHSLQVVHIEEIRNPIRAQTFVVHHRSGSSASDQKELVDVKIPAWLRWDFNRPKSDRKKVRQRTDQMIKHQQLQKELLGETQGKERHQAQ